MRKIRVGNDIEGWWTLLDNEDHPYIAEGKDFAVELLVNTRKVRLTEFSASGNVIHFFYRGKDQRTTGSVNLIYIENGGKVDMVTYDEKDVWLMVPHSWLAVDSDEQEDRLTVETVELTSHLDVGHGASITVDDHLSLESENPVQNKVVTAALNGKQATLVSGENVKTINGQSILGGGNIEIEGGSADARVENEVLIITAENAEVEDEVLIIS